EVPSGLRLCAKKAQNSDTDHRRRAAAWDIPPTFGRREMRHDLELGQHGRLAVLNSRHLSCTVVDLHPGVMRSHWESGQGVLAAPPGSTDTICEERNLGDQSGLIGSPLRMMPPTSIRQLRPERLSSAV